MVVNDEIKSIVLDKSKLLFKLLTYLRDNEKQDISRANLAKYLRSEQLASRLTTLGIIEKLVHEGMLLDDKIMNYQSRLSINPEYDFSKLVSDVLYTELDEIRSKIGQLEEFIGDKKLKMTLRHLSSSDIIKTWKQLGIDKDKKQKVAKINTA